MSQFAEITYVGTAAPPALSLSKGLSGRAKLDSTVRPGRFPPWPAEGMPRPDFRIRHAFALTPDLGPQTSDLGPQRRIFSSYVSRESPFTGAGLGCENRFTTRASPWIRT